MVGVVAVDSIGPVPRAILSERHWGRNGPHAERHALDGLAQERGYDLHDAAYAFERDFGGLELFEDESNAPSLVVGPYACMKLGYGRWPTPAGSPRGGAANLDQALVIAIVAWDDVTYLIGKDGRGWTQSFLDAEARQSASDSRGLVTQAILWRKLMWIAQDHGLTPTTGTTVGAEVAAEHGLARIDDACGREEQWWGNGDSFVVEIGRGNGSTAPMTYAALT